MVICSNCGEKNDDSAKFCQECGTPLTKDLKITKDEKNGHKHYIYALTTIMGVILIILDSLGIISNLLLVPLGLILTMGGLIRLFPKIIRPKAILIGLIAFFVIQNILFILSVMYIGHLSISGQFSIFLISILISGSMAGYFSGKSYLNGCIIGLIIGMVYSIGFTMDYYSFIGGFMTLTIFGLTGGLIGVVIFRKNHSYKVLD
ncbi:MULTISPECIES: zinc ribbon domain-containing protein [Methanobacterium]|jgi:hypothetical protein|uniref:Zinc-ribbon domain-containing protein n=1 Tax=Methanobacterium bryantii TaxID=2161 RepID=A0A2A2H1K8_METBR|nr:MULTISPECIES: zinc ribbon domain-containing protein [Methanobacterium]OEC86269.1 hypothetical protein A9507_11155 [Methanobacterium sp. A39]PAV03163.1 hypothetical protein ASJ80_07805 [Methanobacterium bryantii]